MYTITTPQGNTVTVTMSHPDEFEGLWFSDGHEMYFAHHPEHPTSLDPATCLSYDYTIHN